MICIVGTGREEEKQIFKKQELQGGGGIESRGTDYEISYTSLPEKDGASQCFRDMYTV